MAHFAKIENGIVTNVVVLRNKDVMYLPYPMSEEAGQDYLRDHGFAGEYRQTSYNANFRKRYAAIGFTFDAERDAFYAPQPFPSWTLDEETCIWTPPQPYPADFKSKIYSWDEANQQWVEGDL
jgi:hypothetical protein